jgi:hypothetical protein
MRSGAEIRALRRALLAALAGVLVLCPLAGADGDPASDVLLGQNVFYPYAPPVSNGLQKTLNAATSAAAHARFHIKVALIGGPTDLGVVPELFGKPQTYADFLDRELQLFLGPHPPLLVVMPNGYGVRGMPPAGEAAAASLAKPTGAQTNDLARAAIVGVRKLAAAAGHPLPGTVDSSGATAGGGGGSPWTVIVVALAAVALAGAVLFTRRRLSRIR